MYNIRINLIVEFYLGIYQTWQERLCLHVAVILRQMSGYVAVPRDGGSSES